MRINAKYNKRLAQYILLFGVVLFSQLTAAQTYGLKFNAQEVTLDKRTELDLAPGEFLKFQDEFEISFDYKTTRIEQNSNDGFFGYVFRIVNEDDNNIDLLITPTPQIGLKLVIGKLNSIIHINYPFDAINNWIKLRIKFLLADDKLIFYTPDTFYVQENIGFKKQESLKIIFGANNYKQFKNSDVPSMTIKDLEIFEKGKLKYHWPLNEKKGVIATDKLKGKEAAVFNPSWLMLNHQNWQKIFEDELKGAITVTADTENGRIFLVGMNELAIYSAQKNNVEKIKYKNRPLLLSENYRAIFNSLDKNIYCYLVDKAPLYKLDIETGEWDEMGSISEITTTYRHHNSYFNNSGNEIYLFGGYGFHRYKNTIRRIDLTKMVWEELQTNDTIFHPRYLSGLGSLNDTIYILGGYGSETGDQLINPQSYFDLFGYSIKNNRLFKKFEILRLVDDMVIGNSMWINEKNRNYYALIFNKIKFDNNLQLIKGNLDSPDVDLVGDKIPFQFQDIRTFASLYYMPVQNKLFAYTSYSTDSTTQIDIYSIDNPPNSNSTEPFKSNGKNLIYFYIVLAFLILLGFVIWVTVRRRTARTILQNVGEGDESESLAKSTINFNEANLEHANNNLIFFGGFQVFNKNLADITNKFSPLLKELFLLILLHSFKNNKGISSEKITEVMWYDKSEKSARNNRAVNIAKLRSLVEEIGTCELSKKTGYWKISFNDLEINSDYVNFLHITTSKHNLTKQKVNQLIEITQKGSFLSNEHYDWLDEFKSAVSDTIVDTLVDFVKSCDVKSEADFIVHLADSIFNFDMTNEDAMILKSKAQYCMGKHSHAKATYDKFFKEYMAMYGQEYERSFLDILEIKE